MSPGDPSEPSIKLAISSPHCRKKSPATNLHLHTTPHHAILDGSCMKNEVAGPHDYGALLPTQKSFVCVEQ